MSHTKRSVALALVLALGAGPAVAAAEWAFADIDADGSGEVSQDEFEQVSRAVFRSWDADADQRLSDDELYRGIFVSWDTDQNGSLDEEEYATGSSAWFADPAPFQSLGGNATVSADDFVRVMSETDAIEGTGPEGMQFTEFHLALFGLYDTGGTGRISREDYAAKSGSKLVGGPDTVGLTETGSGSTLTSGPDGAAGEDATAGNTATQVPDGGTGAE